MCQCHSKITHDALNYGRSLQANKMKSRRAKACQIPVYIFTESRPIALQQPAEGLIVLDKFWFEFHTYSNWQDRDVVRLTSRDNGLFREANKKCCGKSTIELKAFPARGMKLAGG